MALCHNASEAHCEIHTTLHTLMKASLQGMKKFFRLSLEPLELEDFSGAVRLLHACVNGQSDG